MGTSSSKRKSWREKLQDSNDLSRVVVIDKRQKKTLGDGRVVSYIKGALIQGITPGEGVSKTCLHI